jgi:hypothetical protein
MTMQHHGAPRDARGAHRPVVGRRAVLTALGIAATAFATGCGGASVDEPSPDVEALSGGSPSAEAPSAPVPVRAGALPSPERVVRPTALRIPAISLAAGVDAVGIDARSGDFAVPPSVDRVGWYRHGPGMEASAGSIVIAGHVDSAAQGRGAFFALRTLDRGDVVEIADAAGRTRTFKVVGVEQYRKSRIPLERYFARDGVLRLSLITCGGPFDEATRHYRDNIVVTAAAG